MSEVAKEWHALCWLITPVRIPVKMQTPVCGLIIHTHHTMGEAPVRVPLGGNAVLATLLQPAKEAFGASPILTNTSRNAA
jgi:hypothetical protein